MIKIQSKNKIFRKSLFLYFLIISNLTGCSSYSSKFKCEDARGLGCIMVHDIDRQIDSGQIEEVYRKKKSSCKGSKCSSLSSFDQMDRSLDNKASLISADEKRRKKNNRLNQLEQGQLYF